MMNPLRIHRVSFKHAFDGIIHNFKTQPNFRFHTLACIVVTTLGVISHLNYVEWLILFFTYNMVFIAEMINTSIEAVVDLITIEKRDEAKIAKDVAAGMVLMSAFFAVIIGIYILGPKILNLYFK